MSKARYTIGVNHNGLKCLRLNKGAFGSFSVQTNGNLPDTHRDGITDGTEAELTAYIEKYGTTAQKRIIKA